MRSVSTFPFSSISTVSVSNNEPSPRPSPAFAIKPYYLPSFFFITSFARLTYASAPFEVLSYLIIGSPKLGASESFIFLGIIDL